ncbi:MAG: hypothetical protein ACLRM8_06595 [Alistipes sp.]
MNYVNPESDGLLAYWRMNAWEAKDGGGNIVRTLRATATTPWAAAPIRG